jgi:DNA ligase-associated metallophosphoesterase
VRIELGGERLTLLPPGGAFLPEHGALLVADLHLGKGAAFRAAGRAVPAGTSAETLDRLSHLLESAPGATSVWVLGDLFHAAAGATPELDRTWRRWRESRPTLEVTLVRGNHDEAVVEVAREWGCRVLDPPGRLGALDLRHEPRERSEAAPDDPCPGERTGEAWGVAGHLHPVVRLREGRRSGLRLPCFWLRGRDLILPALGAFVDGARLRTGEGDRVFVPAGAQVLEIPPSQLPSSARAG